MAGTGISETAISGTTPGIAVWDSSALIPLILSQSKSTALFLRLERAGWVVAATPAILEEVREKLQSKPALRKWLALSDEDIAEFAENVLPAIVRVYPGAVSAAGAVPNDPDDDAVIAAALESGADYIVSEDRHLLNLGNWQTIRILSREQFQLELTRLGVT